MSNESNPKNTLKSENPPEQLKEHLEERLKDHLERQSLSHHQQLSHTLVSMRSWKDWLIEELVKVLLLS